MSEAVTQIQALLQRESTRYTNVLWLHRDSLTESDWAALLPGAIAKLKVSPSDLAIDIITEIDFCYPELLKPYLEELFHTSNYFRTSYHYMPWRDAGPENIGYLREGLEIPERREHAIGALLELRLPEAHSLVPMDTDAQQFADVGFVRTGGEIRQCYPANNYHLQFMPDYVDIWLDWKTRPETYVEVENYPYTFGGILEGQFCPSCGDTLHHLLTFPAAELLPDTCSISSLTLATCNHCLGWQEKTMPLFLHHDETGVPVASAPDKLESPESLCAPFEPTKVALTPVPEKYRWQEWTHSQNIHRLGGHPAWVQIAYYPDCPGCGKAMSFLLQLNSRLPLTQPNPDELEVMEWGSGGVAYFHWCDACRISAGNWQCT